MRCHTVAVRWGYRVLAVAAATTFVLSSCSGNDHGPSAADALASRLTSTSSTSGISSTTTTVAPLVESTAATTATTVKAGASATTTAKTTRTTRAPTTTRPPATTTTHASCIATASGSAPSYGTDNPDDNSSASVTVGNQSSFTVIVNLRGTPYTLSPGGQAQATLAPVHHVETVTAAPTSKPTDRFVLSITFLPGAGYTLNVKTMDIGTCNSSGVRQSVFLRQDGFQS
jgi:hypothetical protein